MTPSLVTERLVLSFLVGSICCALESNCSLDSGVLHRDLEKVWGKIFLRKMSKHLIL